MGGQFVCSFWGVGEKGGGVGRIGGDTARENRRTTERGRSREREREDKGRAGEKGKGRGREEGERGRGK